MPAATRNAKPRLQADAAYENAHLVAQDLLACLRELLQDQPAPGDATHWGHVGSISHVNELLSQAICFLGGFDEEDV